MVFERLELKEDIPFPRFIFSSLCISILELIFKEKRPRQIAIELGISEQRLNNWLNKLEKSEILVRGIKTSYRKWSVNPQVESALKEKIRQFKTRPLNIIEINLHHCSVLWPIEKVDNVELKKRRDRWKSKLTEELVEYNGLFFRAELTPKNFIIRFPPNFGIRYAGFSEGAIKTTKFNCLAIANVVKEKVVKRFGTRLIIGLPGLKGEWAQKSVIARKFTKLGITYTVKRGNSWTRIDKSPHFYPRGEIETNNEEIAQGMLELSHDWSKYKKILDKLTGEYTL